MASLYCTSDTCEWCPSVEEPRNEDLPNDTLLACHCGWLHQASGAHRPGWFDETMAWLEVNIDPNEEPCSSATLSPKAKDCDCPSCVYKRTLLLDLGWSGHPND